MDSLISNFSKCTKGEFNCSIFKGGKEMLISETSNLSTSDTGKADDNFDFI